MKSLTQFLNFSSHFNSNPENNEQNLSIRINEIFHVTDTLHNDQVGLWTATKLGSNDSNQKQTGAIPNLSRSFENEVEFSEKFIFNF